MPNKKKQKLSSAADGTIDVSTIQSSSKETMGSSKEINCTGFYMDSQGENSIKPKLNRTMNVNDTVVLLKDFPNDLMYRGYVCTIMSCSENDLDGDFYYEIEFESHFLDNDLSRKSKECHSDFEFPFSNYTTCVARKDIAHLESQDLYYKTFFS